jgi:hypothetical protein
LADSQTPGNIEAGLCAVCRHLRLVRSDRGSVFYQCRLSFTDPRFVPYPRLPVLHCAGFEPAIAASESASDEGGS